MRIFLSYPGPRHSTFDVARGYEKALKKAGHTVGSFYYHDFLSFYEGAYSYWEEHNPDYARSIEDHVRAASNHVVLEVIKFVPQVILIVAGGALHRNAYDLLHRLDIPMVLMLTESPYIDNTQTVIVNVGHISAVLTNDRNSVVSLNDATCKPVYYLPHSFDPEIHYPGVEDEAEYQSDIFFHGTLWPEREALLREALEGLPYDTRLSGYTLEDALEIQQCHLIDNDELARFYRGTRIALNHHREYTNDGTIFDAYSLGPRAFEIAACGAFQLSDASRPELDDVFGDTVAIYHDSDDIRAQIRYFMNLPADRRDMARAAMKKVSGCTFDNRATEIVIPVLQEVI